MPMPTENILGSGTYTYTDPTGDCLANEDAPVAVTCDPAGIDIREVTYAWQGAGLTILLELGGPGLDSLLLYGVIVGLDLDKNVGTGHSANHEELFGMGIEVEARVDVAPDVQELRTVMGYENNSGQDLNSDWLEWEFTDETHLRVALNPGVVASQSFGVGLVLYGVQSENEDDVIFDFAPDGAYVTVPGGEVVLPSQ